MNAHKFDEQFARLVKSERKIMLEVLRNIQIAEENKLFLALGFSSLFKWLTKRHGYSASCAQQRIEAAKLLRVVPEAGEKLNDGKIHLSNLARAQTYFKHAEKSGGPISRQEKSEILERLENKTSFEAERELLTHFPDLGLAARPEAKKVINENTVRVTNDLPIETLEILDRVREVLSHTIPEGSRAEILKHLGNYFLDREDPLRKKKTEVRVHSERVSNSVRRETIQNAEGKCQFRDPVTGQVCGEKVRIETDHVQMRAHGGGHGPENLRCLCRAHNLWMAEQKLGKKTANRWREKMQ